MYLRFYMDANTGLPHIYGHGVTEEECESILASPLEDRPSSGDSKIAVGQTAAGRYLRVVYVPDEVGDGVFVITAYPLEGRQLKALKKRQRRRKR